MGNTTVTESWTYDSRGRVETHIDFAGHRSLSTYHNNGTRAGLQAAEYRYTTAFFFMWDEVTAYNYDELGRVKRVEDFAGSGFLPILASRRAADTTYDSVSGQVVSVATSFKPTSPSFEALEAIQDLGTIHYSYDVVTGRKTRTYTDNTETAYEYNALGQLWRVKLLKANGVELATPRVTTYSYDLLGNTTSVVNSDGTGTNYAYDALGRMAEVTNVANGVALLTQHYTLASNGQRVGVTETAKNADGSPFSTTTIAWQYDGNGRLVDEVYTSSVAGRSYQDVFAYDLAGNRVKQTHVGGGVSAGDAVTTYSFNTRNQLTSETNSLTGVTTYAYDLNGSQTSVVHAAGTVSARTDTFTYDLRNKMVSATVGGVVSTYAYDSTGDRVEQTTAGVKTTYLPDKHNPTGYTQTLEQKTAPAGTNPATTVTYILGPTVLGQVDHTGATSTLLKDGHGSTRLLLTAGENNNLTVTSFDYSAFGGAIGFTATTAPTVHLFGGDAVLDRGTGMYTHGNGTRNRVDFRFTQIDPRGEVLGDHINGNLYGYVGGNPVYYTDPSGLVTLGSLLTGFGVSSVLARITIGGLLGVVDAHLRGYSYGQGAIGGAAFGALGPLLPAKFGFLLGGIGVADALAAGEYDSALFRAATLGFGYALQNRGFSSFKDFKSFFGKPGRGRVYHHIVEQTPGNSARFGHEALHNPNNVAPLPHGRGTVHAKISGFYSSKQVAITGPGFSTVRQWLATKSYADQYRFGLETMARFGTRSSAMNTTATPASWSWPAVLEPFKEIVTPEDDSPEAP